MNTKRLHFLSIANVSLAIFFEAFWVVAFRVQAWGEFSELLGLYQIVIWCLSSFLASWLTIKRERKEEATLKSAAIAAACSFLLFYLRELTNFVLDRYIFPRPPHIVF
jgi:hypothetical protein